MVTVESVMAQVSFYAWVIGFIAVVGGLAWYILTKKKYNKIVYVRDESSGGNRLFIDSARVIVDKNHVEMWKTWKTKITMAPPSPGAITLTAKGKQMAELLRFGKDNYKWISFQNMPLENKEIKPILLTTAQKQVLANQFRMALEESSTAGNKWLMQAVPIIVIAILLLFGYMHFDLYAKNSEKIMNSYISISTQQSAIAEQNAKLLEASRDIIQNRQTVQTQGGNTAPNGVPVPN
jgi:hypothetical protein